MKGEIIDLGVFEDEFKARTFRITIEFEEKPKLMLGTCEVKQ